MANARLLTFYFDDRLRARAEAGAHNFVNRVQASLRPLGYDFAFSGDGMADRMAALARPGFALFHMDAPQAANTLTMRKNYYYPFWQIERSAKRWEWDVARAAFDATKVDGTAATKFADAWRRRLFKDPQTGSAGFVYVPLQGLLSSHRSFQVCSPLEMLRHVCAQDKSRAIVVGLHPKEAYDAQDRAALQQMASQDRRITLRTGGADALLAQCDYVVTQNSAVALSGYFFHKPAILFGRIDFHHISSNVHDTGIEPAFAEVLTHKLPFDRYLYWFLQVQSINAGREDAEAKILAALRRGGWDL
jgi:hypothetical protein